MRTHGDIMRTLCGHIRTQHKNADTCGQLRTQLQRRELNRREPNGRTKRKEHPPSSAVSTDDINIEPSHDI
eukprot:scaffold2646_cov42-Cyclotella_meneghiniana.AAC.2